MSAPLLSMESSEMGSVGIDSYNPSTSRTSSLKQSKHVPAYALYLLIAVAVISSLISVIVSVAWVMSAHNGAAAPYGAASSTGVAAGPSQYLASTAGATSAPVPTPTPIPTPNVADNTTVDQPNVLVPVVPVYPSSTLMGQIKSHDLLHLLSGLYAVAMNQGGGNRAITGSGFNASVEYLLYNIRTRTNLVNVERTYFLRSGSSSGFQNPFVSASVNGKALPPFVYNVDYRFFTNSAGASNATLANIFFVDGGGCDPSNWTDALGTAPATPFYAIVYQTTQCNNNNRIGLAIQYGATGVIIAATGAGVPPNGGAPLGTDLVVISMTNAAAGTLITALQTYGSSGVAVSINVQVSYTHTVVSNVCGDTPAGDPTSVVLVGGHSDGVASGPGTNDDGSGSIGTLALAIAMTNLMNNASLNYKPPNMVKFCWFGAEEQGLLGSYEVVRVGLQRDNDPKALPGSRARDWAIMMDLDMLGSLNFQNYVYDANVYIPPSTPSRANNGSRIMSNLFFDFFDANKLPRDSDRFDGRSDYGPFLAVGIPAGGVDAGADKRKSEETRLRYQQMTGWGGVTGAINDQCYHRACDHIGNIHWGVYTNMTQSAAYVLEKLAFQSNLRQYLGNPLGVQGEPGKYDMLPLQYRYGPEVREVEVEEELLEW